MYQKLTYLTIALGLVAQTYAQCSLTMPKNTRTTVRLDAPSNCCNGLTFYDSGGATNDYDNGENDTITFVASSGNRVEILFSTYHTEGNYDTLFVYDGGTVRAPLLAVLVREASGPFALRSSGDSLTFRFKSGPIGTRYGWEATLRCVSGTGCQQLMPASGSQTADLGTTNCCGGLRFFDSGGPAGPYGNNQNGVITFTAPAGQQVRLTFGPSFGIRSGDTL
ncbi:MAG: CUB domain-containing protein, partial [Bacteroidia bacterium]|nr:CUB domain-containing protein [Bacteroidia bacterium]